MQAINWRGNLRLMFVRDWPWKMLALVIACMIYFSIRSQISHRRTFSVPVDVVFEAAGTGVVIESVEPSNVQVTLRGSSSDINQLNPNLMQFDISPRRRKNNATPADTETVKLSRSQLRNVDRRLSVVDIEPSKVLVKYDVPMSLQLNVARPEITGTSRGQVRLTYHQTKAVVTGSRRLLADVPDKVLVLSAPIDVEGRTQSFQTRVALYPPGDQTRLKVTPQEMLVNVQISIENATARIERVPVHIIYPPADNAPWACSPQFVDLDVTGAAEEMADIKPSDFSVLANAAHLDTNAATNQVTLTVFARQGTTVTAVAVPPSVELTRPTE